MTLDLQSLPPSIAAISLDIDITVVLQFANFMLMVLAMHFLIIKPYLKVREAREEGTEGSREDADEMELRSAGIMQTYKDDLSKARREALEVFEARRQVGEDERAVMVDDVRRELAAHITQERSSLLQSVRTAEAKVDERAHQLATLMVQKVLPGAVAN